MHYLTLKETSMIWVKVIPQGCLCGWTVYNDTDKLWLTRTDPFCAYHGNNRAGLRKLRQRV
jgi:hypothetical protein